MPFKNITQNAARGGRLHCEAGILGMQVALDEENMEAAIADLCLKCTSALPWKNATSLFSKTEILCHSPAPFSLKGNPR